MVGGRCHDDHQHGGVVELLSSEVSSSIKEVVMKFGEAQCNLRRLDSRCVRVLYEIGHLRLQPSAERGGHHPTRRAKPDLHQAYPLEVINKQCDYNDSSHG